MISSRKQFTCDLPVGIDAQVEVQFKRMAVLAPADLGLRMTSRWLALEDHRLAENARRRLWSHAEIQLQI